MKTLKSIVKENKDLFIGIVGLLNSTHKIDNYIFTKEMNYTKEQTIRHIKDFKLFIRNTDFIEIVIKNKKVILRRKNEELEICELFECGYYNNNKYLVIKKDFDYPKIGVTPENVNEVLNSPNKNMVFGEFCNTFLELLK